MNRTILVIVAIVVVLGGLGYAGHMLDLVGLAKSLHGG